MHLDIQVGEHAVDYANVAHKDKLTELQLRIRQLLDQVHQITKEQSYQRVGLPICYCPLYHYCSFLDYFALEKEVGLSEKIVFGPYQHNKNL